MATAAFRTCPLCEATCGLELTIEEGKVTKVRGDKDDVLSHGFICPKGANIGVLHDDPDRLRTPMMRGADGELAPCSWDEAFAFIDERFKQIDAESGRQAFSAYLGNPVAHSLSGLIYGRPMLKAIGTRNIFSASSVDQAPKQVACGLMFGTSLSISIPDIDRTDYLLILGADPLVSNGSLMTAPDFRGRMKKIGERGGKVVVVDPRRSRTAEAADEHHFIRPGGDALLCFAIVNALFDEGLVAPGDHLDGLLSGVEEVEQAAQPFTPEAVATGCGIEAETIRRIARELAAAPSAAVYGRIGTTTQPFGTVTSWLIDVINTLTGNLDRPGGVMFPKPPAGAPNTQGQPGSGRGMKIHRWATRASGRGEVLGELPVNCLAEEIETPGEGQIRSLITIGGNPVLSTPNGDRLAKALDTLDLMISIDIYRNETSRHAHVILPALSALEHSHFDLVFTVFAIRNFATYSPPVCDPPEGMLDEWEILLRLTGIASGAGADAEIGAIDNEENADGVGELDEAIAEATGKVGLAGAGGHLDQCAQSIAEEGEFQGGVGLELAISHARLRERMGEGQLCQATTQGGGFGGPDGKRLRAMEGEDAAGAGFGIAFVAEKCFDAGGFVQERQRAGRDGLDEGG